jgi:hypothetical protein
VGRGDSPRTLLSPMPFPLCVLVSAAPAGQGGWRRVRPFCQRASEKSPTTCGQWERQGRSGPAEHPHASHMGAISFAALLFPCLSLSAADAPCSTPGTPSPDGSRVTVTGSPTVRGCKGAVGRTRVGPAVIRGKRMDTSRTQGERGGGGGTNAARSTRGAGQWTHECTKKG